MLSYKFSLTYPNKLFNYLIAIIIFITENYYNNKYNY